jgi:hypothetical protein
VVAELLPADQKDRADLFSGGLRPERSLGHCNSETGKPKHAAHGAGTRLDGTGRSFSWSVSFLFSSVHHRPNCHSLWNATEGFKPTPELTSAQEAALLRFDCAYNFGNEKNVLFDVHWNLAAPYFSFEFDVNPLWERLEPITIGGRQLPSLSGRSAPGSLPSWVHALLGEAGMDLRCRRRNWSATGQRLAIAASQRNQRWQQTNAFARPLPGKRVTGRATSA